MNHLGRLHRMRITIHIFTSPLFLLVFSPFPETGLSRTAQSASPRPGVLPTSSISPCNSTACLHQYNGHGKISTEHETAFLNLFVLGRWLRFRHDRCQHGRANQKSRDLVWCDLVVRCIDLALQIVFVLRTPREVCDACLRVVQACSSTIRPLVTGVLASVLSQPPK